MSNPIIIDCVNLQKCDKINTIIDKDWLDCQKVQAISKLCQRCKERISEDNLK